jgi:hypothetical protein
MTASGGSAVAEDEGPADAGTAEADAADAGAEKAVRLVILRVKNVNNGSTAPLYFAHWYSKSAALNIFSQMVHS